MPGCGAKNMKLSPERSLAGILVPVFALRTDTDLGIGDTASVRQVIDWCYPHGLNIFQTLPINETSSDNSPYNAISSLALEPSTIATTPKALPDLSPADFNRHAKPKLLADLRTGPVNYPGVKALKQKLLEAAFASFRKKHFEKNTARARHFRAFLQENATWLADYALFRALMEINDSSPSWERWPAAQQNPHAARCWLLALPAKTREALLDRQLFFAYVQWIAFGQWQALKAYGAARQVYLMGDIPFGVGRASADVWSNRSFFDLDWSGGAPPERTFQADDFTVKWGQNWGVPHYNWGELRRHNFAWWRERVANLGKIFHLYRIDHVLGFFRIYSFPWTPDRNAEFLPLSEAEAAAKTGGRLPQFKPHADDTEAHRAINQAQGEEFLRVVLESSGDTVVVAEDLGCVPEYVPPTLLKLGIPGFRIPMLFRDGAGGYADPKQYPRLSLAQPATHDHPPLAALWAECWANLDAGRNVEASERELRAIMDFAGLTGETPPREFGGRVHEGFLRAVLNSNSWLAVFQLTDVLGWTERFNTPGSVSTANWSHRLGLSIRQMSASPAIRAKMDAFCQLVGASGRGM